MIEELIKALSEFDGTIEQFKAWATTPITATRSEFIWWRKLAAMKDIGGFEIAEAINKYLEPISKGAFLSFNAPDQGIDIADPDTQRILAYFEQEGWLTSSQAEAIRNLARTTYRPCDAWGGEPTDRDVEVAYRVRSRRILRADLDRQYAEAAERIQNDVIVPSGVSVTVTPGVE
jgi:hypothetical protein